MPMLWRN